MAEEFVALAVSVALAVLLVKDSGGDERVFVFAAVAVVAGGLLERFMFRVAAGHLTRHLRQCYLLACFALNPEGFFDSPEFVDIHIVRHIRQIYGVTESQITDVLAGIEFAKGAFNDFGMTLALDVPPSPHAEFVPPGDDDTVRACVGRCFFTGTRRWFNQRAAYLVWTFLEVVGLPLAAAVVYVLNGNRAGAAVHAIIGVRIGASIVKAVLFAMFVRRSCASTLPRIVNYWPRRSWVGPPPGFARAEIRARGVAFLCSCRYGLSGYLRKEAHLAADIKIGRPVPQPPLAAHRAGHMARPLMPGDTINPLDAFVADDAPFPARKVVSLSPPNAGSGGSRARQDWTDRSAQSNISAAISLTNVTISLADDNPTDREMSDSALAQFRWASNRLNYGGGDIMA